MKSSSLEKDLKKNEDNMIKNVRNQDQLNRF